MKTRYKFFTSFGIFFLYFITQHAFACECMETSLEQRIESAKVIFSGSIKDNPWNYSKHHIAANFTVDTIWKGASDYPLIETGNVIVVTGVDDGICGTKFVQNEKYLIYAQIDNNVLNTGSCSGSWFLNGRGDEVRTLDQMSSTHKFLDNSNVKDSSIIAVDIDLTHYVIIGIFAAGGIGAGVVFWNSKRK